MPNSKCTICLTGNFECTYNEPAKVGTPCFDIHTYQIFVHYPETLSDESLRPIPRETPPEVGRSLARRAYHPFSVASSIHFFSSSTQTKICRGIWALSQRHLHYGMTPPRYQHQVLQVCPVLSSIFTAITPRPPEMTRASNPAMTRIPVCSYPSGWNG
jgi:hypothetical protein